MTGANAQKFDAIVFDLDGTLWDTCEVCAEVWNDVARRLGITFRAVTADDVRAVAGLPHAECMRRTFTGADEAALQQLTDITMREDNERIAERGGRLYPGVLEAIPRLAARHRLLIVSNCQAGYIELFLRFSELAAHFTDFECWGNTGRSKSENLRALMARNRLVTPLMIGDTEGDERAARDCGVEFGFAAYGFGRALAPEYTFASFAELQRLLEG